jgi:hypothetical protein
LPLSPLQRDLAANAHPRTTAKLDLDKASSFRLTPMLDALRRDLEWQHGAIANSSERFLRQPPPFEQLVGAHVCRRAMSTPMTPAAAFRPQSDASTPSTTVAASPFATAA